MGSPAISPPHNSLVDFIFERASPEDILAFQFPPSEQDRAVELLDKQDEDALTPDEAAELQQMMLMESILLSLKARAIKAKAS